MSTIAAELRRIEAARRRDEREAKKQQRDLERRIKEQAKLSALEQARLEVEAYENSLEVLLSVHKEQSTPVDWTALASAPQPHQPPRLARNELSVLLKCALPSTFRSQEEANATLEEARSQDQREYDGVFAAYVNEFTNWQKLQSLAKRVLAGETRAYTQAVKEFPAFAEISPLGSSIHMTINDARFIECELNVNGRDVIPVNTKSLTAGGRVAVKAMPKARFHEIYQDYVCSCILRLARELFALLPVETVLLTALVDGINTRTGHAAELPVLSLSASRSAIERLDFNHLVPSDALGNFQHRGDVVASRKSGEFIPIVPLKTEEIRPSNPDTLNFTPLLGHVRQMRAEFDALLKQTAPAQAVEAEINGETAW